MLDTFIETISGAANHELAALFVQRRDPPPFDFKELLGNVLRVLVFVFLFGGPILGRIFGGKGKKEAEKELENRRRRAEALRRQMEAQKRAIQETELSPPIPRQDLDAGASTESSNPGEFGGLASFGTEEELERPWYELDENEAERLSSESILERDGPTAVTGPVGVFATTDVTSIDDMEPLSTLAETHFDSLVSEFETRTSDSLLLRGTAADRRKRSVSRQSVRGAWRRAIILRELLGTPVSMRVDEEDLPGLR